MAIVTDIEDLRRIARRRVPRLFFDYVDSGSWSETTYCANRADFDRIKFRQRVCVNMEGRTVATRMAGVDVAMPVALAPAGLAGLQHADGEILAARAAVKAGVPFTLSTVSICSIEDVARSVGSPFWFQLYVMRDRDFVARLVDRAEAAGCPVLVLTLDLQIPGQRHRDVKNGLGLLPKITFSNLLDMLARPRWCFAMARTERRRFGNIAGHVSGADDVRSVAAWIASQHDPTLTWDDVEWVRRRWKGRLVLKGIMDAEDAHRAAESGADALVVSNHGGRQLDGAPSSIAALPAIVDAVGRRVEVHLDSGIRSGQDVLKAWALGARGTYVGRAWVYGLGADGEAGVSRALDIIRKELDLTMAFCGRRDIRTVDRDILVPGSLPG